MATLREWVARLGGTFSRGRRDIELEQELRLHLDLAAEEERRRSATPESASRMAAIRVGSVAPTMDALRDQRGLPGLEDLVHEDRKSTRLNSSHITISYA